MTRLPFKSRYLIWLAILALAIFLRLFRLGFSPERPTIDEMSLAYNAYSLLESKLMRYGFIDLPEYREQKYVCSGEMHFRVDADFPRLTSDNVVPQIIEVQYSISLASIEGWRVEG